MKLLLFLLSLLLGFHLCSCDSDEISNELTAPRRPPPPPPRRPPPPPPRSPPPPPPLLSPPPPTPCPPSSRKPIFDHFLLTLTWPNAFCKLPGVACRPFPPTQQYFTIHGLWPQNQFHSAVTDCAEKAPLTDAILVNRKQKLLDFWPRLYNAGDFRSSKKLWRDQWCKHGSCSSDRFTPDSYFDKAITLGSTYGPLITKELEAAGIKPNGNAYSWEKMVEAIKKAIKQPTGDINVRLTCEEDTSGNLQLSEIQICVESDAEKLKNCNRQTPDKCKKDLVFASPLPLPSPPPPPPPRSLDTQIFVSSILEGEEAAGLY
ncbi:hypothetical protein L6164_028649 [Bauhinia variegata]|uniref:Uncharacterized protein n=1 Tax=Bauhinia variegata TaxID=167791 RepID=A0ACB9L6B3_BAUVA|nr:hypothetical protein L6164_028649 [Bauhinia variegata]